MPNFLNALLPVFSLAIALMVAVGVAVAFLGNKNKGLSDVQESTITALEAQIRAQEAQIKTLEKKLTRIEGALSTVQYMLKKRRGLVLEINDEVITLIDQRTGAEQTVKIKIDSGELKAIEIEE